MRLSARQRGFTLVEVLVVISIIGILMAIGVPQFRGFALNARLNDARPVMDEIAEAAQRKFLRSGEYWSSGNTVSEDEIIEEFGIPVDEYGDFCFMMVCRDKSFCESTTKINFIAAAEPADAVPAFEVWAVLRNAPDGKIAVPGDDCDPADDKRPPTGWVQPANSSEAGREGQVVALRYPPPLDGADATTGEGGHRYTWDAGLSKTHALHP